MFYRIAAVSSAICLVFAFAAPAESMISGAPGKRVSAVRPGADGVSYGLQKPMEMAAAASQPNAAAAPLPKDTGAPAPAPEEGTAAGPEGVIFPTAVARKFAKESPGMARMHTCLAQYWVNKRNNALGGLRWMQKGGGYYSRCNARLKKAGARPS